MRSRVSRYKSKQRKMLVGGAVLSALVLISVSINLLIINNKPQGIVLDTQATVKYEKTSVLNPDAPKLEPVVDPDYRLPPTKGGLAPVITSIKTDQKVVFLGIDDGAFQDQSVVDIMKQNDIKASLFLAKSFVTNDPVVFHQLVENGAKVENHSLKHDTSMVKNMDYAQQKAEICGMSDYVEKTYGRRPVFFRPPGGAYNDTMRRAVADCGMKAIIHWIAKANGGSMQYQVGNGLRAGDVVLMHFRPEFKQDIEAFVQALDVAGLKTAMLPENV